MLHPLEFTVVTLDGDPLHCRVETLLNTSEGTERPSTFFAPMA